MKRDMSIIREVLLLCEQSSAGFNLASMCTSQEEKDIYGYHVQLLDDAGYVKANVKNSSGGHAVFIYVERMTWQGTELLESLRNESVFKQAMKRLAQSAGAFSIALFQKAAEEELLKLI